MPMRNIRLSRRRNLDSDMYKTTCLLCSTLVWKRFIKNEPVQTKSERRRCLLNLCALMGLNHREIPGIRQCEEIAFPLCVNCNHILHTLTKYKKISDHHPRIPEVLKTIQETVLDGEYFLPGKSANMDMEKAIYDLREKNPSIMQNEPLKFMKLREMIIASTVQQAQTETESEDDNLPGPSSACGTRALTGPIQSELPGPSRAVISAGCIGEEREDRAQNTLRNRPKRSMVHNGVEYRLCVGLDHKEFFKCDVCAFTVPVPLRLKYVKGDMAPKTKMFEHIDRAHKNAPVERRRFGCAICPESFRTLKALHEHKDVHSTSSGSVCEICGRLIKTSRNHIGFLTHLFTHKNDEERKAAIVAGEKGSEKYFVDPSNKIQLKKRRARPGAKNRM